MNDFELTGCGFPYPRIQHQNINRKLTNGKLGVKFTCGAFCSMELLLLQEGIKVKNLTGFKGTVLYLTKLIVQ